MILHGTNRACLASLTRIPYPINGGAERADVSNGFGGFDGWITGGTSTVSSAATATNRIDSCHPRNLGL